MSQQYSLRWNNHQPNFISMFTSLLQTQTLVDVTLAAEGQQMRAHKVVLSACSNYFQSLFVDNPSQHPIVILKDVTFSDLRIIVDFMYYGVVNVSEEQLPQVLETAKTLMIKGLTEMPDSTSLTRSQGTSADFPELDSQRAAASPGNSPSAKKRKRRQSSAGSVQMNSGADESRADEQADLVRDAITLSSVPQQRRARDYDERAVDTAQQNDQQGLEIDLDGNQAALQQQGGSQWNMVVEHTYPRFTSSCLGGAALQQQDDYMSSVLPPHMGDMDYGGGLGVAGPSAAPPCLSNATQPANAHQTPLRRRRTINPQAEENFQRALEAVRSGGIGFCKAARLFGVNNRTLWLEFKKRGYTNTRPSIRSRIKREHTTPPPQPQLKEEVHHAEPQQMALFPPHAGAPFMEARPLEFSLQNVQHNLQGLGFNTQLQ